MFCEHCGTKKEQDAQFCQNCGKTTSGESTVASSIDVNSTQANSKLESVIKCGSCGYIGQGEPARTTGGVILAWLCVFFAPIVTLIYFAATHKYRCSKCKSTFLGVKNKEGVFIGKQGTSAAGIFIIILVGIAIIGILASVVLASLNAAREKAKQAEQHNIY
jgi:DNA-directed RNA polymerase subunit RPC12/RpoP